MNKTTITEYSIRNFRIGDEHIMTRIFNQVIVEFDTEFPKFSPEQIKLHQPFYGSSRNLDEYVPEDIIFLLNSDNKEIGYVESSNRFERFTVHYPIIVKEYRSIKTLNLLFMALYDSILERNPKSIRAVYNKKYPEIHNFFRTQIHESIRSHITIHETERFGIPVENIRNTDANFEGQPFKRDKIKILLKFCNSSNTISGTQVSVESINQGFDNGKYTQENSFLITQGKKIFGWVCGGINFSPFDYDKTLKQPIGVLRGIITDASTDVISLRKAMFYSLKEFFLKNHIDEFRIWAVVNEDPYSFYNTHKEYGFTTTGESEYIYQIKV